MRTTNSNTNRTLTKGKSAQIFTMTFDDNDDVALEALAQDHDHVIDAINGTATFSPLN